MRAGHRQLTAMGRLLLQPVNPWLTLVQVKNSINYSDDNKENGF